MTVAGDLGVALGDLLLLVHRSAAERWIWVTCDAEDEKTWAISQATKPPPTIAIRAGRASRRITVSDVWTPVRGVGVAQAVDVEAVGA